LTAEEVLTGLRIEGMTAYLPPTQLDRKVYLEVKGRLELIGGKWKGGRVGGFVFPQDPSALINDLRAGKKRNLKKEFQFFETPPTVAEMLVRLAQITAINSILEPSAGQGAIVKAIRNVFPTAEVDCYELMKINRRILAQVEGANIVGEDFFSSDSKEYARVIANPPFSHNQDIDHIRRMYDQHLEPGGRLVTVASTSWRHGLQKKQTAFRDWVEENGDCRIIELEGGAFSDSGAEVAAVVLVIDK